jgi:2',3'-cyclic-nucleotide 2'-phosphodiesterase (5'-nucleotidase family)
MGAAGWLVLAVILSLGQAMPGAETHSNADSNSTAATLPELSLTFLHINDVHGQMTGIPASGKETGGYARLATQVREFRARTNAQRCFLVHAGDEFSVKRDGPQTLGTALSLKTHGAADVPVLNALRLDCWAPGNGEFYGGLSNLQARFREANFSVLTANVLQRDAQDQPLGKAFVIESAGPVKVAFLGLNFIHDETLKAMPLTLADPLAIARKLVPELRRQADVVVAVTHIGLAQDRRLAAEVEGLDLILGGHSHSVLPKGQWATNAATGRKVLICQTGDYLRRLGVVEMKLAHQDGRWQVTGQTAKLIVLDDKVKPDEAIAQRIGSLAKEWEVTPPPRPPATNAPATAKLTNSAPAMRLENN